MKKRTLLLLLSLAGVLRRYRTETHRLEQNQRALLSQVERYRTRAGEAAASAEVLQLRCREFERLRAGDAERIRQLGIRLRRVEAAATLATATEIDVQVPLHDTIVQRDFAAVCDSGRLAAAVRFDTVRSFRWRDPWVTVEGHIRGDSADCRVESVDTLRQVIHRVPRRFLFIRFGTKAVRQEIEVEREFCIFPRSVALKSAENGRAERASFKGDDMFELTARNNRLPLEFTVSVRAQRENRFTVAAHNELVFKLVQMGMVTPDIGLELMLFDGKQEAQARMRERAQQTAGAEQNATGAADGPSGLR